MKKFYNYKAKEDESVNAVASELKNLQHSIREIKDSEAPTNLAVAICLMGVFDSEAYHMAIFHLKREPNLTLELALESLKSVEQSVKDKDEAGRLNIVLRADDREPRKCYHCGRLGHVKLYCFDWLNNTPEERAHAKENPDQERRGTSKSTGQREKERDTRGARKETKSSGSRPASTKKSSSTSISQKKYTGNN